MSFQPSLMRLMRPATGPAPRRAVINAAATTTHRLLLETLWQSGGRVTEVLRLRPCDLDAGEPVLHLVNLKQRAQAGAHLPRTPVIVSPDLVAALRALTNDAHLAHIGYFFRSRKSQDQPMSYGHCWRLIRRSAIVAGSTSWAAMAGAARHRPGLPPPGRRHQVAKASP